MLTENGKKLTGILAFYGDNEHKIGHTAHTWFRDKKEFAEEYKKQLERVKEEEKLLAAMTEKLNKKPTPSQKEKIKKE